MLEYKYFGIFLIISIVIACLIYFASYLLIPKSLDYEKLSAYECGFYPFEDARNTFDVKFYLVAILFIIFDLEVIYLFPWAVVIDKIDFFGLFSMVIFLLILTIGFVYEWVKGGLDWD
jgi:NADH:ubiquinone oxidoreductase subunit 3 (subunit A)